MAQDVGSELPPDLVERFQPSSIAAHAHKVVLLVTRDEDGWPRPAVLSYFEIVVRSVTELRVATYTDSTTANNLRRDEIATLIVIDTDQTYYIKGVVEQVKAQMLTMPHSALMRLRVAQVLADQADPTREGSIEITSGITYDGAGVREKIESAPAVFREMLS